jgi:hypothetical protein
MERLRALSFADKPDNPVTMPAFSLYGSSFPCAPINTDELELFKAQFGAILTMPGSDERRIMLDRLDIYVLGMRAIKKELGSPTFKGLNAGDTELGMGIIRPQFVKAAAVVKTTWTVNITAAWTDWFYGAAGNPFNVGQDFGMVVTHLKSLITPEQYLAEYRFNVDRTVLLPQDGRAIKMGDNTNQVPIIAIPSMVLKPKASFYGKIKGDSAHADQIQLGGLIYGFGRVLKEETATWT